MPTLQIIIASTRPGRGGLAVSDWFVARARAHGAFEIDIADLAEIKLPFVDEPNHPRLMQYTHQHTKEWSARGAAADAFVIVLPEYNYSFPATIKNAIDFLHNEWKHKPVGFASYGGVSAGTRSVQQLKPVVGALSMFPVSAAVSIPFYQQFLDDEGAIRGNETMDEAADAMLSELAATEIALRPLRGS